MVDMEVTNLGNHCWHVVIKRSMSRAGSYDFYHGLQEKIGTYTGSQIVIDIGGLLYVDSTFWSRILEMAQRAKKVILIGLKGITLRSYQMLGIDVMTEMATSLDQAKTMLLR